MSQKKPFVAILMGSDSDFQTMKTTIGTLKKLEIAHEVRILSAHHTPAATTEYVRSADERGCDVFIAAAGMAAHLAGTVAALTMKPVIGVPINVTLDGLDALLSTVQMPGGVPVATVAIGEEGAKNAAYLAGQILATKNIALTKRLQADRDARAQTMMAKNIALQDRL